jgi:hypothetical protein
MATKKTSKTTAKKSCCKKNDVVAAEIKKVTDELVGLAKKAKKHYDQVDDKTKKQVVAGIAGAAGLIAAAIGISQLRKRK